MLAEDLPGNVHWGELAASGDASRLFVGSGIYLRNQQSEEYLSTFDAETGELVATRNITLSFPQDGWGLRAVAASFAQGQEQQAWTLHANGYQVRWDDSLQTIEDFIVPPPWPETSGGLACDLATTPDGTVYMTSLAITTPAPPAPDGYISFSLWGSYLHRRSPAGEWSTIVLYEDELGSNCSQVSYDAHSHRVAVTLPAHDEIRVYTPSLSSSMSIPVEPNTWIRDIALHQGPVVTLAVGDELRVVLPDGEIADQITLGSAMGVDTRRFDSEDGYRVWWSGRDILNEYDAGRAWLGDE